MQKFDKLKVTYGNKELELPVIHGTEGVDCVEVGSLEKELNLYTFDPAFLSTASCHSKITFIDGDKGILAHRGILIDNLVGERTFHETFFLLFTGKKHEDDYPEFEIFKKIAMDNMKIDDTTRNIITSFKKTDHPMAMLMSAFSHVAAKNCEEWDSSNMELVRKTLIKISGEFLACVITVYRYIKGKSLEIKITPHFTETICLNMFDEPHFRENKKIVESVFNKLFVLHADHEQNASTSTVRIVASTEANPYAAIVSGVGALWGHLHGGANEAVVEMLDGIKSVSEVPSYIAKVKTKEVKLMGFGHRVYKNYDPRARLIKDTCSQVLETFQHIGDKEKLLIAMELEKQAINDEYFTSRKLFPNVDFYSGIIYKALDVPTSFFTAMFAAARVAGWCSQMYEFYSEPRKISRPRQLYIGERVKM